MNQSVGTLSQSFLVPQSLTKFLLVPHFLLYSFHFVIFLLIFFFLVVVDTLKMAGGRPGGTTGNTQVHPTPPPQPSNPPDPHFPQYTTNKDNAKYV